MNEATLRIALVSREYPPFYGGGIGTYARWIVPALAAAGVRVHVITEAHDRTHSRVEVDGLTTVHRVPVSFGRGGWTNAAIRFSISAGRRLAELWQTGQIDVAEFAECEAAACASALLRSARRPLPIVVQLHTPSEQLFALRSLSSTRLDASLATYILAERLALRLADGVLAPSAFIANWATAHYGLACRPAVIPYATGPLPPAPGAERVRPGSVLYVGRIEPRKGVESLIRAWRDVVGSRPRARLRLAGADTSGAPDGGSMKAWLLELLGDTRDTVDFLGRLGSGALGEEYARASLCVAPSLWENFPNTCIEAMSHGRPVLVGDAGGMKEMIGGTPAGETFISGDERDLARQMGAILDEGVDALAARGRIARQRIKFMCDPATIARRRMAHFHATIEGCQPAPVAARRDAMLSTWRGLEQVGAGRCRIDLPAVSDAVERWVERREVATSC